MASPTVRVREVCPRTTSTDRNPPTGEEGAPRAEIPHSRIPVAEARRQYLRVTIRATCNPGARRPSARPLLVPEARYPRLIEACTRSRSARRGPLPYSLRIWPFRGHLTPAVCRRLPRLAITSMTTRIRACRAEDSRCLVPSRPAPTVSDSSACACRRARFLDLRRFRFVGAQHLRAGEASSMTAGRSKSSTGRRKIEIDRLRAQAKAREAQAKASIVDASRRLCGLSGQRDACRAAGLCVAQ